MHTIDISRFDMQEKQLQFLGTTRMLSILVSYEAWGAVEWINLKNDHDAMRGRAQVSD